MLRKIIMWIDIHVFLHILCSPPRIWFWSALFPFSIFILTTSSTLFRSFWWWNSHFLVTQGFPFLVSLFGRVRVSRENRLSASSCTSVREIWYWIRLWKPVEKLQIWLKLGKSIGEWSGFIVFGVINSPWKQFLCSAKYFYIVGNDL